MSKASNTPSEPLWRHSIYCAYRDGGDCTCKPQPVVYQDALDRAARYYREALKEVLDECSHDEPRIWAIKENAERGLRAADYELAEVGQSLQKTSGVSKE